ncbi:hypothetical protein BS78_02G358100 [Paspalum vaginatum]|nr:hypothetical protein BS78_02G358100 [Paspalum vaginatum]KAJ1291982.1 hypothetical protein BS78_02G358100 [Paspalum vaginatum]
MRTIFSFAAYSWVHVCLVSRMCQPPNRPYWWIGPLVFFFIGFTYFCSYANISSYGTHISDWIATACFTLLLLVTTVSFLLEPPTTPDVVEHDKDQ